LFTTENDQQLLKLERGISLENLVKDLRADRIIVCAKEGKEVNIYSYLEGVKDEDIIFIVGGFPKGNFNTDIEKIADELISIYDEPLTAWTVAGELLSVYNLLCG